MKQKLAKITVYKNTERVSVLIAPEGVHPTVYSTCEFKRKGLSFQDNLRTLAKEIIKENFILTEGCKINEKMNKVYLLTDQIFNDYPNIKKLNKDIVLFPEDLSGLINGYKEEYYQIIADYLCTLIFHKQFPFKEKDIIAYTLEKIKSLNEKIDYLFKEDKNKLSEDNFKKRLSFIEEKYDIPAVFGYLKQREREEKEPLLKEFYNNKARIFTNLNKDNIAEAERFLKNLDYEGIFEIEKEEQSVTL